MAQQNISSPKMESLRSNMWTITEIQGRRLPKSIGLIRSLQPRPFHIAKKIKQTKMSSPQFQAMKKLLLKTITDYQAMNLLKMGSSPLLFEIRSEIALK